MPIYAIITSKNAFWVGTDYLLYSSDRVGIGFSRFRLLAQTERSAGEKSRISSAGLADFLHRGGLTQVFDQNYTEIFTTSYRKVFQRLQNYIRNARTLLANDKKDLLDIRPEFRYFLVVSTVRRILKKTGLSCQVEAVHYIDSLQRRMGLSRLKAVQIPKSSFQLLCLSIR